MSRVGSLPTILLAATCLALLLPALPAVAQDSAIPDAGYFASVELVYRGDYQRAERSFTRQWQGAVQTAQARWIDSICFRAMWGETFYQRGQYERALQQYNQACELALAYPNWLMRVEFRQPPRRDTNPNRLIAPWGRPTRAVTYGALPETMLIGQGRINNNAQAQRGGVIQQAQFWRVRVTEILRCTALAIRRRNEILGPLGPHDRLSKELATTFSRGDLAPRNHWSGSWTELLLGLSQAGVGETEQALRHLNRAVLLDGRFDHELTGVALLAQAELALASGNARAASGLLLEASYAGFAYDDYDVVAESLRRGHETHVALGGEGVYPPLAVAAEWARREGLQHLVVAARIDSAESLALAGDSARALNELSNVPSRAREVLAGRLGPKMSFVKAIAHYAAGNPELGAPDLATALDGAQRQSLRNFQIALANQRYDGGEISPRIAVDLYAGLLADPVPGDWALELLQTLAHQRSNHEEAFARWFNAALGRKEVLNALEIADQTKRTRFWRAQPLGGRLLTLRMLLDGPIDRLPQASRLERQGVLARHAAYEPLAKDAAAVQAAIAGAPLLDGNRVAAAQVDRFRKWQALIAQQEAMLRPMALSRASTTLVFPPTLSANDVQQSLEPGQALLVFHQVGTSMHAILVSTEAYHPWRLPDVADLGEAVAAALQGMGNFTQGRTIDIEEIASDEWRESVGVLGRAIFGESRLDLSQTTELIIVPDGVLWHVPFETVPTTLAGSRRPLGESVPIRYAPTVGLALGYQAPTRPVRAAVLAVPGAGSDDEQRTLTAEQLAESVSNPLVVGEGQAVSTSLIAGVIDTAVSLVDAQLDPESPYGLSVLSIDRNADRGSVAQWMTLPVAGPERIVLANLSTAAETGLKPRRRSSRDRDPLPPGREMFHATCGMMASGAQTVLLTRWRTGGQTHRELLSEFVREVPHMPAGEAWRRSVMLARSQPLDAESEPRIRRPDTRIDMPNPDHPFLWGGYLLIDTGRPLGNQPAAAP